MSRTPAAKKRAKATTRQAFGHAAVTKRGSKKSPRTAAKT
jgi:hypothetical protein